MRHPARQRAVAAALLALLLSAACAGPKAHPEPPPTQPAVTPAASGEAPATLPAAAGTTECLRPVARLAGNQVQAFWANGATAYVAAGSVLDAVDLAQPSAPRRMARLLLPGPVADVCGQGQWLYVAGEDGLAVIDISAPDQLRLAATVPLGWPAARMLVAGRYAYVAGAELAVVDLANPASPQVLGRLSLSSPEGPLGTLAAVQGDRLHMVYANSSPQGGVRIVDAGDPRAPRQAGSLPLPRPVVDLALLGSSAYALDDAGGLHLIDLHDGSHPSEVPLPGGLPWRGQRLAVLDHYVYLVGDDAAGGLAVLDAAEPGAPRLAGRLGGIRASVTRTGLAGNRLYVASGQGLLAVDVSDPTRPAHLGAYAPAPGLSPQPVMHRLAVQEKYAYAAAATEGLYVLDCGTPSDLRVAAQCPLPGHAWDVAVAGSLAYVAAETAGLRIVDVSDPLRPAEVGAYDPAGLSEFFHGVALAGRYACVADGCPEASGLRIVDIADPRQPREVAFWRLPGGGSGPSAPRAESVAVVGDRAYLAAGSAGLIVFDLSAPASPRVLGTFRTPGRADNLVVAGHYAYLVDGDVRVVDVGDPAAPVQAGFLELPDGAAQPYVAVQGARLYLSGKELQTFDIADPVRPRLLCTRPRIGGALAVDGAVIYAVDGGIIVLEQG